MEPDWTEEAMRGLVIMRRALRNLPVQVNGATMSIDAAYGTSFDDLATLLTHHRWLEERKRELAINP